MRKVSLPIEDVFTIKGRGLVLMPGLPNAKGASFEPFVDTVFILAPEGNEKAYRARIHLEHFHFIDRPGAWRVVLELSEATRKDFPPNSQLFVRGEILSIINKASSNNSV